MNFTTSFCAFHFKFLFLHAKQDVSENECEIPYIIYHMDTFPFGLTGSNGSRFHHFDKDGKEVSLSALRGKYVLLDFWGTWCQACMKELPDMKRFHKKHREELVIISVDCHDEESAWKEIVEDYKLKWTQVRDSKENRLAEKYGVSVFPTKFLINPDGKILFRLNGENKQFFKMKWRKDVK
ncbi:MAG: TlpA family protein disulfide reductase [Bacteroidaceae bacterium]|nr:TlpA family protein disulfide reductase [Bacteroidaceae bacterium]